MFLQFQNVPNATALKRSLTRKVLDKPCAAHAAAHTTQVGVDHNNADYNKLSGQATIITIYSSVMVAEIQYDYKLLFHVQ